MLHLHPQVNHLPRTPCPLISPHPCRNTLRSKCRLSHGLKHAKPALCNRGYATTTYALQLDNRELLVGDCVSLVSFALWKQIAAIILLPTFPGWLAPLTFNPLRFIEFGAFAATLCGTWVACATILGGYKMDATSGAWASALMLVLQESVCAHPPLHTRIPHRPAYCIAKSVPCVAHQPTCGSCRAGAVDSCGRVYAGGRGWLCIGVAIGSVWAGGAVCHHGRGVGPHGGVALLVYSILGRSCGCGSTCVAGEQGASTQSHTQDIANFRSSSFSSRIDREKDARVLKEALLATLLLAGVCAGVVWAASALLRREELAMLLF